MSCRTTPSVIPPLVCHPDPPQCHPELVSGSRPASAFMKYTKYYYVYILTNRTNEVLYIGVTNNLIRRIGEHKKDSVEGFTKKYKVHKLVYFQQTDNIESAIIREKQIKNWHRQWKINLITKDNPEWNDLYDEILK